MDTKELLKEYEAQDKSVDEGVAQANYCDVGFGCDGCFDCDCCCCSSCCC